MEQNQDINQDHAAKYDARKQEVEIYHTKKKKVEDLLNNYQTQIANALPSLLNPKAFTQSILTSVMKNPDLLDCTPHSLIGCALTSAQLGLMLDNVLGEAYIIPFNNNKKKVKEAQFIPGYKGLCSLARRTGKVLSIKAVPVYKDERFIHEEGLEDKLVHTPGEDEDPLNITHVYARIKYTNGGYDFVVLSRKKIEQIRDESKNYKFATNRAETIWHKSFTEMAKKTAIRALMKLTDLSPDINRAVSLDESADIGKQNTSVDWIDDVPEYAEVITDEIITENQEEKQEQDAANRQASKEQATGKGEAAMTATETIINKKKERAARKNAKPNPPPATGNEKIQPK